MISKPPTKKKNKKNTIKYKKNYNKSYCGRGERIDENIKVKIADLGNACWTFHHFATKI